MRSREASALVDELHRQGGVPWPSERRLLKLFLRFVRDGSGHVGMQWSTRRLAAETDSSYRGIEEARARLVRTGLVEIVRPGSGRSETLYRVALERLPMHVLPGLVSVAAVHPGEKAVPDRGPQSHSECGTAPHSPWDSPTLVAPLYAHARVVPELPGLTDPLTPTGSAGRGTTSTTTKTSASCPMARKRGRPCENCRRCGTTRRQLERAEKAAAKAAEVEARKAAQLAARDEFNRAREAAAAAAAERAASGRSRYQEWVIEQHLREMAEVEKSNQRRETG